MKKVLSILICSVLIFTACQKEADTGVNSPDPQNPPGPSSTDIEVYLSDYTILTAYWGADFLAQCYYTAYSLHDYYEVTLVDLYVNGEFEKNGNNSTGNNFTFGSLGLFFPVTIRAKAYLNCSPVVYRWSESTTFQ